MILEFDIGNSNIKWRFRCVNKVLFAGSHRRNGEMIYDDLLIPADIVPQCISVVSVCVSENRCFANWCINRWGLSPQFAVVDAECAGVLNGYHDVSQMGPDRWLAMIAAYNLFRHDCLIIDSGSACTVDLILKSGQHLGGYIVPGLELMKNALFRDTDQVKLTTIDYGEDFRLGRSTSEAVSSGVQLMLLGLVSIALDELLAAGANRPFVVIAGGGAQNLVSLLNDYLLGRDRADCVGDIVSRPDLVFEGLPFVCC